MALKWLVGNATLPAPPGNFVGALLVAVHAAPTSETDVVLGVAQVGGVVIQVYIYAITGLPLDAVVLGATLHALFAGNIQNSMIIHGHPYIYMIHRAHLGVGVEHGTTLPIQHTTTHLALMEPVEHRYRSTVGHLVTTGQLSVFFCPHPGYLTRGHLFGRQLHDTMVQHTHQAVFYRQGMDYLPLLLAGCGGQAPVGSKCDTQQLEKRLVVFMICC